MPDAASFLARHVSGPGFIMPNAWDAGSAIILAWAGFEAIGSTSAGVAFSLGKPDYAVADDHRRVNRAEMFDRLRDIVAASPVPVSADLEAGYGDEPEDVAETVRMALDAGLAGANIEDKMPGSPALYDVQLAVERIVAAREAIDATERAFVLTARSDAIIHESAGLQAAVERSNRYREAGADCLFTPGVSDLPSISRLVREIDGPLNMVLGLGGAEGDARSWIDVGVRRVSVGGSIARAALGLVKRAAEELMDRGTISYAVEQLPQPELNAIFSETRARF